MATPTTETGDVEYARMIGPRAVRIERLLPGPIERVLAYLTEAEKRATWLAAGATEPRVGGHVELVFRNSELTGHAGDVPPPKYAALAGEARSHGRVTAWDPPHALAYTWSEGGDVYSQVRFELSAEGAEVRLVVTHAELPDRDTMLSVAGGWHTHLDILRDRLCGRMPPPFWATHTLLEAEYDARIPQ